jgi:hypothetical protein
VSKLGHFKGHLDVDVTHVARRDVLLVEDERSTLLPHPGDPHTTVVNLSCISGITEKKRGNKPIQSGKSALFHPGKKRVQGVGRVVSEKDLEKRGERTRRFTKKVLLGC